MAQSVIFGDQLFRDGVAFGGTVNLPPASVVNENIETNAQISATKLVHRHALVFSQKNGIDVAAETKLVHIANAAGTILTIVARVTTAPTGGDKAFTVNVQKAANGSGSWTSLLTAPISFAAGDVNDTLKSGVVTAGTYNGSDALRVVIAVSGTTGSQGQGVDVLVFADELAA